MVAGGSSLHHIRDETEFRPEYGEVSTHLQP